MHADFTTDRCLSYLHTPGAFRSYLSKHRPRRCSFIRRVVSPQLDEHEQKNGKWKQRLGAWVNSPLTSPPPKIAHTYDIQISIFVDAISSAIGPAIIEATAGTDSTKKSAGAAGGTAGGAAGGKAAAGVTGTAAPLPSTGTNTARDRNNRRRRNGELAARSIGTYIRGSHQREGERGLQRAPFGDSGDGVSKNSMAACHSTGRGGGRDCAEDDGSIIDEETIVWTGVALAEARRKMLDPPNVSSLVPCVEATNQGNF